MAHRRNSCAHNSSGFPKWASGNSRNEYSPVSGGTLCLYGEPTLSTRAPRCQASHRSIGLAPRPPTRALRSAAEASCVAGSSTLAAIAHQHLLRLVGWRSLVTVCTTRVNRHLGHQACHTSSRDGLEIYPAPSPIRLRPIGTHDLLHRTTSCTCATPQTRIREVDDQRRKALVR